MGRLCRFLVDQLGRFLVYPNEQNACSIAPTALRSVVGLAGSDVSVPEPSFCSWIFLLVRRAHLCPRREPVGGAVASFAFATYDLA